MNNRLELNGQVARNTSVNPDDTLKVKNRLLQEGDMDEPDYGIDDMPDEPMFQGIQNYQSRNGLTPDGVMNPGVETETHMNRHPGLPGPAIPNVMPGPGQGMSAECLSISQQYNSLLSSRKELEFKIQQMQGEAKSLSNSAFNIKDISDHASNLEVGLAGLSSLLISSQVKEMSRVVGIFIGRITPYAVAVVGVNELLTRAGVINNTLASYSKQMDNVNSNLKALENKAQSVGCNLKTN